MGHAAPRSSGESPLFDACRHDAVQSVEMLLKAGADPNFRSYERITPLIATFLPPTTAGWDKSMEAAAAIQKLLLKYGADPNAASGYEFQKCDNKKMAKLSAVGENVVVTAGQRTPLHYAALEGSALMAQSLIDAGATGTLSDFHGILPVEHTKDKDCRKILLALHDKMGGRHLKTKKEVGVRWREYA
mmetsp:Transcript_15800/g.46816  ORF Transcript_15800/g.46816 Transcript_15800/m.46816 type:complete len:188 (-) Transcript_15800:146-709(-)